MSLRPTPSVLFSVCALLATASLAASATAQSASQQSRWDGLYGGAGVTLNANGINISGTGKRDAPNIEQGTAGLFAVLGYNHLVNGWLLGIEADLGGGAMDKKKTIAGLGTVTAEDTVVGSVRARFGYAWNNVIVYGTAGAALSHLDIKSSLGGKDSGYNVGAVAGLGAEYAFDNNWAIRGETLLYGFNHDAVTLAGTKRDIDSAHVTFRLGAVHKF